MKLTDKTCGICKNQFTVNDDIVVCPECGEAYHRDCYNKNGKCINEEIHEELKQKIIEEEIEEEKNPKINLDEQDKNPSKKICVNCKSKVDLLSETCPNCGGTIFISEKPLDPKSMEMIFGVNPNYEFDEEIKAKDLANFTLINSPYYLNTFKNIKEKNKSRFNFSAFLFGGGWCFYRKQFLAGLIAFLSTLAIIIFWSFLSEDVYKVLEQTFLSVTGKEITYYINNTQELIDVMPNILNSLDNLNLYKLILNEAMPFLLFVVHLICGFVANRIYYKSSINKVKRIKKEIKDESKQLLSYRTEGGVSLTYSMWYMMIIMAFCLIFL